MRALTATSRMHPSLGDVQLSPTGRAVSAEKSIPYFDVVDPLIQRYSSASINLRQHNPVYGVVSAKQWPEAIEHDLPIDGLPCASVALRAPVPKKLEFEPLPDRHGSCVVRNLPETPGRTSRQIVRFQMPVRPS
jgi:hypothetical protein